MEKKKPNIKLIVIISVVAVLIIGTATAFGIVAYGNYQTQQRVEAMVTEVADEYALFENSGDREEKLSLLEEMISEYESYVSDTASEEYFEEVKAEYEKNISLMREYFISEYDSAINEIAVATLDEAERDDIKTSITSLTALNGQISAEAAVTLNDDIKLNSYSDEISGLIKTMREHFASQYDGVIKENTFENVEEIEDKEKLSNAITNLNELKTLINEEADVTVDNEEVLNKYNEMVDNLIESYENRISAIEKAEEEARQREEEERNNSYNSSSNNSNNSSGDSSSNNSSSNSNSSSNGSNNSTSTNSSVGINPNNPNCVGEGHGGLHHSYTSIDENGNPTGTRYAYNDGCAYDYDLGISWVWGF